MVDRCSGGQGRQPLLVPVLRPQLDRVEDAEDGRLRAFPGVETEVADPARYDQANVVVLDAALRDAFLHHPPHHVFGHGDFKPDRFCGGVQAIEVGVQPEYPAAVGTDALEDAVAIQEAVVEYRNDRAAAVVPGPIDPHDGGHRRNLPPMPSPDNRG